MIQTHSKISRHFLRGENGVRIKLTPSILPDEAMSRGKTDKLSNFNSLSEDKK